ncbi:MAG: ArsC family reductase [Comamonas sp.]
MIVYGIPNCDTVKKARQWLTARDVAHEFHDFKKRGVPPAQLARWIEALGWPAVINRQGTTWRKLDGAAQAGVQDAASASALALAQPSLVKRPVVEWPDGSVSVGFEAENWSSRLVNKL